MNILCLCERGNSRSVALAWMFKDYMLPAHNAIAGGMRTMDDETKKMLYEWADRIILVDKMFENEIPEEYKLKLKIWDVGPDRFFRGFEQSLLDTYVKYINEEGI